MQEALHDAGRELDAERAASAKQIVDGLGDVDALDPENRDRATVLRLRCDAILEEPADRTLLRATQAAFRAVDAKSRAELLAQVAYGYIAKRCGALAMKAADAAAEALPDSSIGPEARGAVHLAFDRRDDARADYERGADKEDGWRCRLGMARVAFVCGDFDGALAEVERTAPAPRARVRSLRLAADVARVRRDFGNFLSTIDEVIELTHGGYRSRSDAAARASALFALGRDDEALEAYRGIWREKENDWFGNLSRTILNNVERAKDAATGLTLLPMFPTVTQKRNYCGPATLELVLRYLGVTATQDAIAETVKRETGTSTVAMTRYLESLGLRTIRFEGTASRLGACIALGLPVIVEEEYSITNHVAVVIGVDTRRGVLLLQDPMTHVTQERLIETEGNLGRMFRNAAIVALKPDDEERTKKLSEADVVETPHIRLVDECSDDALADKPDEVIKRCDEAIRLCDDYPLAWMTRLRAEYRKLLANWKNDAEARYLSALRAARVRYPTHEWPHQSHAYYLMARQRPEEALIEWAEALRLDPWDSNNAQYVAECHQDMKRRDDAAAAFWKTLTIDPAHIRATENFASLALDREDVDLALHLSVCAREMAPKNPFNFATAARIAEKQKQDDEAIEHLRQVVRLDPAVEFAATRVKLAGRLAAKGGKEDTDEALGLYLSVIEKYPATFESYLKAAAIYEQRDDLEKGSKLLVKGFERAREDPTDLVRAATRLLREMGRDDEAIALAEKSAAKYRTDDARAFHLDFLFDTDRREVGLPLAQRFASEVPDSSYRAGKYGKWLIGMPAQAEAEAIFRKGVEREPNVAWRRDRLVDILIQDRVEEAIEVLLAEPKPTGWTHFRRAHCLNLLGRHADALEALKKTRESHGEDWWDEQVEWTIAVLGDEAPPLVLARLTADDAADRFMVRSRAAIAGALARHDDALAAIAKTGKDDRLVRALLAKLIEHSEAYRDVFEARHAEAVADAKTMETRRYLRGVAAGLRAARGDRALLDAHLRRERNVNRLRNVFSGLGARRHAAIFADVREAIAARGVESPLVSSQLAHAAAARGDHGEAVERLEAAMAKWPQASWMATCLAEGLLSVGQRERAAPWVAVCRKRCRDSVEGPMVAGLASILDGDVQGAAPLVRQAERRRIATGVAPDDSVLLMACHAVIAQDAAALEAARVLGGWHTPPDAPIWKELAAKIAPHVATHGSAVAQ